MGDKGIVINRVVSKSGMKWMSGGTKRQYDRTLAGGAGAGAGAVRGALHQRCQPHGPADTSEKGAKLAQKLGQLQPFL